MKMKKSIFINDFQNKPLDKLLYLDIKCYTAQKNKGNT